MINAFNFNIDVKTGTVSRDGISFTSTFLSDCCHVYERICTAQYIHELKPNMSYQKCFDLACEARDLCDDYGYTEAEAIDEILD